jgi:hypothetical protein
MGLSTALLVVFLNGYQKGYFYDRNSILELLSQKNARQNGVQEP